MTPHEFKRRLKQLGLSTGEAARQIGVSRHAVMHWKAGRRAIPNIVPIALDSIELRRRLEFLS
jgi:transcriptional regulator with XRE-family HTH domain